MRVSSPAMRAPPSDSGLKVAWVGTAHQGCRFCKHCSRWASPSLCRSAEAKSSEVEILPRHLRLEP